MDEKTAKSLKTQLQAAASQIDSQAGSERAVNSFRTVPLLKSRKLRLRD